MMLSLMLSACASATDIYPPPAEGVKGKDVVVFVHGYYGSALREPGGPRRFISIPTLIAGSFRIALNAKELGLESSPALEVEGMLGKVTVLPYLYANDVYAGLLDKISPLHPARPLAYDWRKDLFAAVQLLDAEVRALHAAGARSVSILAHSMGGLVASYYLAYGAVDPIAAEPNWAGAARVKKVVFFGVPFGGTISILRNMQLGTGYPWNEDMLEADTVASFPASYHLLGLPEMKMKNPEGGHEIFVQIANPNFWAENHLGLARDEGHPAYQARLDYTREQLARALRFTDKLRATPAAPKGLEALNVVGTGRPTLALAYFDGREFIFRPREAKAAGLPFGPLEAEGDGTVTLAAAAPPAGYNHAAREVRTTYSHEQLFRDPRVQTEVLDFLRSPKKE